MVISEIESAIKEIGNDTLLLDEKNFESRQEAIDFIEFHVVDRIDGLLQSTNLQEPLKQLKKRAEEVKYQLETIDQNLFQRLREDIRKGNCTGSAFKEVIDEYLSNDFNSEQEDVTDYDNLDVFINGLFHVQEVPEETKAREPEMVFYQKTPASIILELVEKAPFQEGDVFYDLGSGLGQIPILVHLLTGIKAKGVEFEPAYHDYAQACAASLNLSDVVFINEDARVADYSDGTIFFMYTPFGGKIMEDVLEILHQESLKRNIAIFTYGPCTLQVAKKTWLYGERPDVSQIYRLSVFSSVGNPELAS